MNTEKRRVIKILNLIQETWNNWNDEGVNDDKIRVLNFIRRRLESDSHR